MAMLIQPNPEMQVMIRKELNEQLSSCETDLQIIKEWLWMQPHLPNWDDDQRLRNFLRASKYSIEKCKRKLDMYFTMRQACPELFTNRSLNNPEIQQVMDLMYCPVLPGLTPDGRRVNIFQAKPNIDLTNVPSSLLFEAMKVALMIGDIRIGAELTGVAGDIFILDAAIATPYNFARVTPAAIKKFLTIVQEAYPVKLKQVHLINISPFVDTIVNFVKPFLKEKIRQRIHSHSKLETLYEYIPRDVLPEEFGGTAGTMQSIQDQWIQTLRSYDNWFKDQENYKANEALRPGKPYNYEDLFGMEGTFRKLQVD